MNSVNTSDISGMPRRRASDRLGPMIAPDKAHPCEPALHRSNMQEVTNTAGAQTREIHVEIAGISDDLVYRVYPLNGMLRPRVHRARNTLHIWLVNSGGLPPYSLSHGRVGTVDTASRPLNTWEFAVHSHGWCDRFRLEINVEDIQPTIDWVNREN